MVKEACVENAAPALIRLYDYYNSHLQTTVVSNKLFMQRVIICYYL